jgi:hypothetical protein
MSTESKDDNSGCLFMFCVMLIGSITAISFSLSDVSRELEKMNKLKVKEMEITARKGVSE